MGRHVHERKYHSINCQHSTLCAELRANGNDDDEHDRERNRESVRTHFFSLLFLLCSVLNTFFTRDTVDKHTESPRTGSKKLCLYENANYMRI